jgi:PII-like signaling protein
VSEGLKLTVYFAERDRAGDRFLADALLDLFERTGIAASVMLRGFMGIGARHSLQSELSLTLSESLPAVAVAVDRDEVIAGVMPAAMQLATHGLLTLERARLGFDPVPDFGEDAVKLTVYGGRGVRSDGEAGYVAAVDALRAAGVSGASVLLGVDGTMHGERRRARFFARNAGVPLMLMAIGDGPSVAAGCDAVVAMIEDPIATVERVQICRGPGRPVRAPRAVAETDEHRRPIWQKLVIHASEQALHEGRPLFIELIRELRAAGAAGATVLRGVRGFYGDAEPVHDRFLSVRRHAPVTAVIVDRPPQIARLWPRIEALTDDAGLVTSELVPAYHAPGAAGDAAAALAEPWA